MSTNTDLFFVIFNLSQKNPVLDVLMIFGAKYLIYIAGFSAGTLLLFSGKRLPNMLFFFLSLAVAFLLVKLINLFFYFPRPFINLPILPLIEHLNSSSFPSLHTTGAFSLAFVFIFLKHKMAPFFIFVAVWIALARIFVGVHYPLDIMGGILTGFTGSSLAWLLGQRLLLPHLSHLFQKGRG